MLYSWYWHSPHVTYKYNGAPNIIAPAQNSGVANTQANTPLMADDINGFWNLTTVIYTKNMSPVVKKVLERLNKERKRDYIEIFKLAHYSLRNSYKNGHLMCSSQVVNPQQHWTQ